MTEFLEWRCGKDLFDACYAKDPDTVYRDVAGEAILVPIRSSVADLQSIYLLNEVALRIWELLDGVRSLSQIREVIASEYDVDREQLDRDIASFIEHLQQAGVIVGSA